MAAGGRARFVNDLGAGEIAIGVTEFECQGAAAPHDHPHIFLDMGARAQIRCPYCGTLFVYDALLGPAGARPPECLVAGP